MNIRQVTVPALILVSGSLLAGCGDGTGGDDLDATLDPTVGIDGGLDDSMDDGMDEGGA